jgi:methylated-DNA-[protein]-cysteine S-methyltransferase
MGALAQIREYLAGARTGFELPLDLSAATRFRRAVLESLLAVPYGATVSYADLAERVGSRSPRAVGQAVGWNPLPIVVPCHRVVTRGGRLGGYSGGIDRKVALLALEGTRSEGTAFRSRLQPA